MSAGTDKVIDGLVAEVLEPLLADATALAAPVLAFVPAVVTGMASAALLGFARTLLASALALLVARGKITISTSGEVTIVEHLGAHPNDNG